MNLLPADLAVWASAGRRARTSAHEVDIAMVGKYADLTESYKSLSEALVHAGIHTRSKVNIHYVDSEEIEKEGVAALSGHGSSVPGVASEARRRKADQGGSVPRASMGSLIGTPPACSSRSSMRATARARQCQQHGVRSAHAASRRRAHHRVAESYRSIEKRSDKTRTRAEPCPASTGARWCRSACPSHLRLTTVAERHRHRYEAQQSLPAAHRGGRPGRGRQGQEARSPAIWSRWWSSWAIPGSSAASSTRSPRPIPAAGIRFSSASCRARSSTSGRRRATRRARWPSSWLRYMIPQRPLPSLPPEGEASSSAALRN